MAARKQGPDGKKRLHPIGYPHLLYLEKEPIVDCAASSRLTTTEKM
jgi:hypothetical protein